MSIFVFNVASKCGLIWFAELHAKTNSLKKKTTTGFNTGYGLEGRMEAKLLIQLFFVLF